MVALVAAMRKLLLILNANMRDHFINQRRAVASQISI